MTLNEKIQTQIDFLDAEQRRVKVLLNEVGMFDCTTAPFVIVKNYRDAVKAHLKILYMNLENDD